MLLLELLIVLLLCAVGLGWLARHFGFPYPMALVLGGAALGLLPGLPQFPLDPQLILIVVLPPILYQAALLTSWTDFKAYLRPISFLAIGLVVATTLAVGLALKWLVPGVPWAVAFVLGAIISPPDAVAATAILSRLNIPRRVVTVLEGESLLNDASGLVIYKFAVAAVLTGGFSLSAATGQFSLVALGGVVVGWVLAFLFIALHKRLKDPFIEVLTSLIIPYATYVAAESLHVSGVLAVVAAGLVRGRYSPEIVSAEMRIMARSMWNLLVFLLNSLIFILIGLQMPSIMDRLSGRSWGELLFFGLVITLVATLVRFAWVYWLALFSCCARMWQGWGSRTGDGKGENFGDAGEDKALSARELAVVSWCGMRGMVSLAAALALPLSLPHGEVFPERDLVIFLSFFFIAISLLGQGLTLPSVIRYLKVGVDWDEAAEHQRVRSAMGAAALAAVDRHIEREALAPQEVEGVRGEILQRMGQTSVETPHLMAHEVFTSLQRTALLAERAELIRLWRANEISDEVMRHEEEILDYREAQIF